LFEWLDIISKFSGAIIGVLGLLLGAFIANKYESRTTAANLINQREQAETNLRATMFNNLIKPIIGEPKTRQEIDPERELLLVELLALNFHNHFELKPLLVQIYRELQNQEDKNEMESVARRIIDRQVSMLRSVSLAMNENVEITTAFGESPIVFQDLIIAPLYFQETDQVWTVSFTCPQIDQWTNTLSTTRPEILEEYYLQKSQILELADLVDTLIPKEEVKTSVNSAQNPASFINQGISQCIRIHHPTKLDYSLEIGVLAVDYNKKSVDVSIYVERYYNESKVASDNRGYEFEITPFDFPLTDNTEINSNYRFSVILDSVDPINKMVSLRLVWFPKSYITERERPVNYSEIRKNLGLEQ
jgi:hypothetical protein